jgi:serine/threonine protein kinase
MRSWHAAARSPRILGPPHTAIIRRFSTMDEPDPPATHDLPATERTAVRRVGRYEILEEIGHGAMGVVYKARQPDLNRLVALKQLHDEHARNPEVVRRFAREPRLAGSLSHQNIVTVHQYIEEDGACYIVMEYMPRGSLRPWVGGLSLAQLAGVLEGLLAGLAAVEPAGVVHRDLKPENVMVTDDGRVKIADFGVAKATKSANVSSFMTAFGTPIGTPAYMAPEQVLGETVGPWTDLYAVGVMTYEQLVGHTPFHGSDAPMAIMLRHVHDPIPPPRERRPDVDSSLSEWVARLLVKEPSGRPRSATQAWEELEEIVLELLGPRWRRDARLPERRSVASGAPLTPAPFAPPPAKGGAGSSWTPSHPAASRPAGPDGPELESGFRSFGRAPTGAEQRPLAFTGDEARSELDAQPVSAHRGDADQRPPGASPEQAQVHAARRGFAPWQARARATRLGRPPARRLASLVLLAALMGGVGFLLAPSGESAKPPAQGGGSSGSQTHGPSRAYAVALSEALVTLNDTRAAAGARLAHATSARGQAVAAQRLAHAQEQAAATVRKIAAEPRARAANAAIATALAETGGGYAEMARAASGENRREYDSGRAAVVKGMASLALAFAQLQRLGYRVGR